MASQRRFWRSGVSLQGRPLGMAQSSMRSTNSPSATAVRARIHGPAALRSNPSGQQFAHANGLSLAVCHQHSLRTVRGPDAHATAGTDDGAAVPAPQAMRTAMRAVLGMPRPPALPRAEDAGPPIPAANLLRHYHPIAAGATGMPRNGRSLLVGGKGIGERWMWRASLGQGQSHGLGARLPAAQCSDMHAGGGGGGLTERATGGQGCQDDGEVRLPIFPGINSCGHTFPHSTRPCYARLAPNDFSADSRYEWSDTLSQGQPQRAAGKQAVRLKASGPILDGESSKKRSVLVMHVRTCEQWNTRRGTS